jgi:hypothetical protein
MQSILFKQFQSAAANSNLKNLLSSWRLCAVALTLIAASDGLRNVCLATAVIETATLGPTGVTSGLGVYNDQFIGVRFELTSNIKTAAIGGHFFDASPLDTQYFGAIVTLTDGNDFPDSFDLSTPDVLATALLSFPETSADTSAPLSVDLIAGHYALVFGSGLFGATGNTGGASQNNNPLGTLSWMFSQDSPQLAWLDTNFDGVRFFITAIPEPSAAAMVITGVLAAYGARRKRHRSCNIL